MVTLQTILNAIVNSRYSVLTSSSHSGLRACACDLAHQQHARAAVCSARSDSALTADAHRVCSLYTQGAGYVPSTMEDVLNSAPHAEDSEDSDDMLH
jgi:hypothetical protein